VAQWIGRRSLADLCLIRHRSGKVGQPKTDVGYILTTDPRRQPNSSGVAIDYAGCTMHKRPLTFRFFGRFVTLCFRINCQIQNNVSTPEQRKNSIRSNADNLKPRILFLKSLSLQFECEHIRVVVIIRPLLGCGFKSLGTHHERSAQVPLHLPPKKTNLATPMLIGVQISF